VHSRCLVSSGKFVQCINMLYEDQSQLIREHWLIYPIVLRAFSWKSFFVFDLFDASPLKDRNRAPSAANVNSKIDLIRNWIQLKYCVLRKLLGKPSRVFWL